MLYSTSDGSKFERLVREHLPRNTVSHFSARHAPFGHGITAAVFSTMTWLDLANLLFEQSNALSPRSAHVHPDTAGWLRTWTPHQNQAADAAALHFARRKEWPFMEPEPACQIYFRCLFAIERCFEAHTLGPKPPKSPDAEQRTLEMLLIDAWHLKGMDWAERRYRPKLRGLCRVCA